MLSASPRLLLLAVVATSVVLAQPIDCEALVKRHHPVVRRVFSRHDGGRGLPRGAHQREPWIEVGAGVEDHPAGETRGVTEPRTVSRGSSTRTVLPPTPIASKPARSQCT